MMNVYVKDGRVVGATGDSGCTFRVVYVGTSIDGSGVVAKVNGVAYPAKIEEMRAEWLEDSKGTSVSHEDVFGLIVNWKRQSLPRSLWDAEGGWEFLAQYDFRILSVSCGMVDEIRLVRDILNDWQDVIEQKRSESDKPGKEGNDD